MERGERSGRFPRRERLTGTRDFQTVFQQGERIERPSLIVLWKHRDGPTRVGFAVSRQTEGAVQRNRVRRRLREAYRATRRPEPLRADIVIVARRHAATASFEGLVRDIGSALDVIATRRPGRAA